MNRTVLWMILLLWLAGAASLAAGTGSKGEPPDPDRFPIGGVDLHSLTESVSRRARDLDLADLRIQEERKLLERIRDDVARRIEVLDRKLTALERLQKAREEERREARRRLARVFRSMKADEAAARLQVMGIGASARILRELKEKDAGKIMASMKPRFAASVAGIMEKP
ncbi:MAG: hypothetical protein Kow00128_00600 [Deltaproteobacteria bacterium]